MTKKIKLTRESVCLADDVEAPNLLEIDIQEDWTILQILNHIIKLKYLPKISGGKATWSVAIDIPIAVMSQENNYQPKLICLSEYPH